jgi:hypothetical protein
LTIRISVSSLFCHLHERESFKDPPPASYITVPLEPQHGLSRNILGTSCALWPRLNILACLRLSCRFAALSASQLVAKLAPRCFGAQKALQMLRFAPR